MIEEDDHPAHPDERWLVSYADFITLLFALFVLLYALSNSSKAKAAAGMNSVAKAVGMRPTYGSGGIRPGMAQSPGGLVGATQLAAAKARIAAAVAQYPNSGLSMTIDSRGLVISLSAAKFFPSGEDQITPDAAAGAGRVGENDGVATQQLSDRRLHRFSAYHHRALSRQLGSQRGARVQRPALLAGA